MVELVDGVAVDAVAASGVDAFLQDLAEQLRTYTYRPSALRRVKTATTPAS
ncbi:hypothetical protein ACIA98_38590 [Streptomyces sp. NPDC051366]|uniref:hypothetical protein n=1 Tax=Streptomyces sp. NPDC051366 TaxID=3365652 RepID=UPI0037BBF68B